MLDNLPHIVAHLLDDFWKRDRRAFLSYYSWQVFVRMPDGGTRRITGPRPR